MIDLDSEGLTWVNKWALKYMSALRESDRRMAAFRDGLGEAFRPENSFSVMMAGATLDTRERVLDLERAVVTSQESLDETMQGHALVLARARAYTATLRQWLEALS